MRNGFEEDEATESLHTCEGILKVVPLLDGLLKPLELLLGESYTDCFTTDLSGPLVAGSAGTGSAILDVALANPTDLR